MEYSVAVQELREKKETRVGKTLSEKKSGKLEGLSLKGNGSSWNVTSRDINTSFVSMVNSL